MKTVICWIVVIASFTAACILGFYACDPETHNRDGVIFLAMMASMVCFVATTPIGVKWMEGKK